MKQRAFKGTPFTTLPKLQWKEEPTVTIEAVIAKNFSSRELGNESREYLHLYNNGTLPIVITVGDDNGVVVICHGKRLHQGTDLLSAMRVVLNGKPCTSRSSSSCHLYISNFTSNNECQYCVQLANKARSRKALADKTNTTTVTSKYLVIIVN